MTGRRLTAAEIDKLAHVARAWRLAPNTDERDRCASNLVDLVNRLHVDDVTYVTVLPHLEMRYDQLLQLRKAKPVPSLASARQPAPTLHALEPAPPSPEQGLWLANSSASTALEASTSIAHSLSADVLNSSNRDGPAAADIVIVIGALPDRESALADRPDFNREAGRIRHSVRIRRLPVSLPNATLVDIQDAALKRPFILHLAAHREFGATWFAGADGQPIKVLDKDLARAIAPTQGAPSAIMLSFCDSHEVAALIEDRDIAVISFCDVILDAAARDFWSHLYDALAVGQTVGESFEVAAGAARGSYGLNAVINPHSSAHGRKLPAG